MALASGTRIGVYEVVAQIGAGGMGEVYRALDTKLNRDVALKILPDAFAEDAGSWAGGSPRGASTGERLARFRREAHILAALNHPGIAAIYGLEDSNGETALVMEYVPGPDLADRIGRGPVPRDEALSIARQIAEALEAAHAQGIVHRDLKPANIKLRSDGTVKVLDFGLAKIGSPEEGAPNLSHSPTMTAGATRDGVILGTVGYMSPEQARGRPLDKRSDIWSFGCVLYEMLAGRSAFRGETVSDTIVAVLEREPDWSALPDTTEPAVRRLLQRCFEKDPRRRLHDVADARIEIEDALTASSGSTALGVGPSGIGPAPVRDSRRERVWIAATAALAVVVVLLAALLLRRPAVNLRPLRLSVVPPAGTTFTPMDISGMPHFAMSPDGSRIAFVASARGARPQLWVQQLESGAAQPLPGTEDATGPFWAPDSQELAFFAQGRLKRISIGGAVSQDLGVASGEVNAGAWNGDGIILFGNSGALLRISASGGPAVAATALDASRGEFTHRRPQFLPDGRRFIFHVSSLKPENSGVFLGSLDSTEKTEVIRSSANAVFAASGHLLFDQAGTLMVQPFDVKVGALSGQASAFGDRVVAAPGPSYLALSTGADGTIAYWNGQAATTELLWYARDGRPLGKVGPDKPYQSPALSPGARNLLISEQVSPSRTELWNIDLSSGVPTKLTFSAGEVSFARFGIWSHDGKTLLYSSYDDDGPHRYQMTPSGSGQQPVPLGPVLFPEDWSRDGNWIVYNAVGPKTAVDIWAFDVADSKFRPIVEETSSQLQARLSPDGRWLAYSSDESGQWEVYVRPFPDVRSKRLVSTAGGSQPVWRGDGRELFYVAADNRIVAVPIVGTETFELGVSHPLFATRLPAVLAPWRTNYAVSADGQRFLVNSIAPEAAPATITIAVNWHQRWNQ